MKPSFDALRMRAFRAPRTLQRAIAHALANGMTPDQIRAMVPPSTGRTPTRSPGRHQVATSERARVHQVSAGNAFANVLTFIRRNP